MTAEEKGGKALAAQAVAAKVAFDGKDRKAIGNAVKKWAGIEDIKGNALKKQAAVLGRSISTQVEALPGTVISGGNIMQAVSIGLDTNIKDLAKMDGGRPAAAFLLA